METGLVKQAIKNIIMQKVMPSKLKENIKIKRISTSPYFKESFVQLEKSSIEVKTQAVVLPPNSPEAAEVLITNTQTDLSSITVEEIKHCKLMIHPNSGYDNFPAEFVKSSPFPIILGNSIRANAVTNFILSSLFAHYSPPIFDKSWNEKRHYPRRLISELTILILGEGHIGSLLKSALTPLAKEVIVYDPYKYPSNKNISTTLSEVSGIDVVIPACSLNAENLHFMDRSFLMKLAENFLLINAARGSLINTVDLIDVLKNRPEAFAVLDVFENEPADFSLFSALTNCRLSSHIAGVFKSIDGTTAQFEAQVIFDFLNLSEEKFMKQYQDSLLTNRLRNQHNSQNYFLI
jgi:D-3-phosphoglycerate dehydrogenase